MTVAKMIAAQILCSLVISCNSVNTNDMTGLLSRLYRSAAQNNRPLVLVIDRSDQQHQKYPLKASNLLESSDEKDDGTVPAVFLIKNYRSQPQRPRTSNQENDRIRLYRGQYKTKTNLQKYKGNKGKLRVYGSTPSPVLKSLLRFKNEVNCKANNECQKDCEENYSGKKLDSCEDKCEEDFECDDPAEDYDECDPDNDDCDEDQNPSTRGERLVTETPTCTRC